MSFDVRFTPTAEKDVRSLPATTQRLALRQITTLEAGVSPDGKRVKKLKGIKGSFFRLRIGDYRAVFEVEEGAVVIHRVIDRKDLERVVSRLK
ncbi:MAG: hypothetical protein A2V83_10780 [Nitrospirae bacterium RBG_16_64_22]|nr:MAG: hypothetical protein A2V83_10780 [Nitrospirae bacterium RBG_16_64_22]